jgi:large subunit ribosomal protein L23
MHKKSPYDIIKSRYLTEKAAVLQELHKKNSNPSLTRCDAPKYVFLVDKKANKAEIAAALEEIYAESHISVCSVNTINTKPKPRKGRQGRVVAGPTYKKAIVTLKPGNEIPEKK